MILNANGQFDVQVFSNDSDVFSVEVKDANDVVTEATIDNQSFVAPFSLSPADTIASLAANAAQVDLAGASIIGSSFANFADNLDLTVAGSFDGTLGTVTLGTVSGNTTYSNNLIVTGNVNVNGSDPVTAPNYQLNGENVGLRHVSANTLALVTASTDSLIIDSGNRIQMISGVGINVAPSSAMSLRLRGAGSETMLTIEDSGAGSVLTSGANSQTYSGTPNAANAAIDVFQDSTTSRSINASGTLNASGADYAEYMVKFTTDEIKKGDIVGFNADGLIVNKFSQALSFGIKSTDPSYVGGDVWGIGEAPKEPELVNPEYTGSHSPQNVLQEPRLPREPVELPQNAGESDDIFKLRMVAYQHNLAQFPIFENAYKVAKSKWNIWKTAYDAEMAQFEADQITHQEKLDAAQDELDRLMPIYQSELETFETAQEAARQTVDRIAFSGVVPVNVKGNPGDFIIPIAGPNDTITGKAVAQPTFEESLTRVGKVLKVKDSKTYVLVHMG